MGVAGLSHSCVHADFSWRAGFPVRDLLRVVSAEEAPRNFFFTVGWVSASSVVSHTEPLAPAPDPSGTENRRVADRVDDLGDEHHRSDLARVTAGFRALRNDHVDTGVHMSFRVLWPPGQCTHELSCGL